MWLSIFKMKTIFRLSRLRMLLIKDHTTLHLKPILDIHLLQCLTITDTWVTILLKCLNCTDTLFRCYQTIIHIKRWHPGSPYPIHSSYPTERQNPFLFSSNDEPVNQDASQPLDSQESPNDETESTLSTEKRSEKIKVHVFAFYGTLWIAFRFSLRWWIGQTKVKSQKEIKSAIKKEESICNRLKF